jgi:hypothetical protein
VLKILPKPIQPGRKEYLTGNFYAGVFGPDWIVPIADYNAGDDFTGRINRIDIKILDD